MLQLNSLYFDALLFGIKFIQFGYIISNSFIYFIFRWIYEGHFPINRINLFLPENVVHGIGLRKFMLMSSRNQLNLEMTMLLIHFKADQLPNIDFKKMAVRFCDELQLPSNYYSSNNRIYQLLCSVDN